MGIKTYQEKNTKPMKKTRAQSGLPVKRIYIKFTTTLIFDPYIVIFQIFRPHVRGVKRTFWQKLKIFPDFKHKTAPKNAR